MEEVNMPNFPLSIDEDDFDEEMGECHCGWKSLTKKQKKDAGDIHRIMKNFNRVGFKYPSENYIYRLAHNDKEATKMVTELFEKDIIGVVVIDYSRKKPKRGRIMILEPGEKYWIWELRCIAKNTQHKCVDFTFTKERTGYA